MRFSRGLPDAAALLLILLLVSICFWKLAFTKQYTFLDSPDLANQVMPWYQMQARALRQGELALWDPYLWAGQPLLAQFQPGVSSPLLYLLLLLPLRDGYLRQDFVHWWFVLIHVLAGWFAYALFRELGVRRPAAVVGALLFATAGYNGLTDWPNLLICAIWLPLIFLFLVRLLRGSRPLANGALAGLFLGLSWLSGHFQVPLFVSYAVGGTLAVAALPRLRRLARPSVVGIALVPVVAGLVAGVQLLPSAEYGRRAIRWAGGPAASRWEDHIPYYVHQDNGIKFSDLLWAVIPGGNPPMAHPYVGVVALIAALLAVSLAFHRPEVRLFSLVGLGGLLFALSRYNPLHGTIYALVPFAEKARSPAMALCVWAFGVASLAALGLHHALERPGEWWVGRAAIYALRFAGALGALLLLARVLQPALQSEIVFSDDRIFLSAFVAACLSGVLFAWHRGQITARSTAGLCALLMLLETGSMVGLGMAHKLDKERNKHWTPVPESQDIADFLRRQPQPLRVDINGDQVAFNFGDWHGIETTSGYTPSALESITETTWYSGTARRMIGSGYYISKERQRPEQEELFTSRTGFKIFRNPDALPRAWTVHDVRRVPSFGEAAKLVRESQFDPAVTVVLTSVVAPLAPCGGDQVHAIRTGVNWVTVDVTMRCRGLLVVGDVHYPGWTATANGQPMTIHAANGSIRAVELPAGTHHVQMRYRPASVYLGLALTIAGLALTATLWRLDRSRGHDIMAEWGRPFSDADYRYLSSTGVNARGAGPV